MTEPESRSSGQSPRQATAPEAPFPVVEVGRIPFRVASLDTACAWILREAGPRSTGLNVRLANAYNVALASVDPVYGSTLREGGVNFPDGKPITWFMRLHLGLTSSDRPGRVRGPSLFSLTLHRSSTLGVRHFFLGSTRETLLKLETAVRSANPSICIAGSYSPPFSAVDDAFISSCIQRIEACEPDIIWIGLGTPKQDEVGTAIAHRLKMLSVNVGAAFDFAAGTVREAPKWVQDSGFEWLYRLAAEPRRLWKRYLWGNMHFLMVAFLGLFKARTKRGRQR